MQRTIPQEISGSQILAHGAIEAGVQFVTGYPGSPSTSVVDALKHLVGDQMRIEWAINEKSAFDTAFGASLAGMRALLCLKSVGLNVALDSLMVSNLAAGDGGFVLLVGDDPGGWGSQNEEDSRPLVAAAEVPLLEPVCVQDAQPVMEQAFHLSERFRIPVAVRMTRAMALARGPVAPEPLLKQSPRQGSFERQGDRFNVLPIHVVDRHRELQAAVNGVQSLFETSTLNRREGHGEAGVVAAGFAYQKVRDVLARSGHPPLSLLGLGTLHPLPEEQVADYLRSVGAVLVLEETAPYLETHVQALAQRAGLALPVCGRLSGHVPRAGELFERQIAAALGGLIRLGEGHPFEAV